MPGSLPPKPGANSPRLRKNFRAPMRNPGLLMSIINYASREIQFKIVYYGPALCGKTTNLGYIHQRISPQYRGDLVSLATAADCNLFFDVLSLNAVTQTLHHKFSKQSDSNRGAAPTAGAQPPRQTQGVVA